jgi:PAS domain S-box-containing protein
VTTVWAPTGIAIAALLLWGPRLWPAVWCGAFLANAATNAPLWTAAIIATGNTLEAVAATWVLRERPQFDVTLGRVADVLWFVAIAAGVCTALSATVGVAALCAASVQPWGRFAALWFDWWLGDALGALIVAPVILTTLTRSWSRRDWVEASIFVAASIIVADIGFGRLLGVAFHPLEYVVFPVVIVAAVRGGLHVTSLVVLSVSAVSIWHTVRGAGPFAGPEVHQSLILLQAFMGVLAGTALLLAAAVAERQGGERREKEAAQALRRREEMLTLAQRAGGVATFDWDFRNQTAQCSSEFFRIFGLPARDGVMSVAEWGGFVHPDDRDRMAAHLARALDGAEPAAADYRINAADGATRWLSYGGQIRKTPDGDRMVGAVVDITDRKRLEADLRLHAAEVERILEGIVNAEAELRQSRDVLSLAMRGGSMGAWSRDIATNEVWWSRELEDLFGLPPGGFNSTEAGFFEYVHDEDRGAVRKAVDDAVQNRSDYVVEFRFRHTDGGWRWMEGRGRATYAEDGAPRTLYGIGIDVTARKGAEIALRDAKAAAESANELKDQFLATLSHELRTPLNAILGYARMLQTNSIPPEKRQRAIDVIERNAVAQNQLVEDLLDMSRITTGKVRLDPEPVPVVTVLRDAVEGVKPAADAKGVALEVDLDPFAGTVRADTTRLQQVFWNLLTNAVKFSSNGDRVTASLQRDGAYVKVVIEDTGIGISPEFLPFVFEPFRQANSRFDRGHGGLGLGLAISRQLVELHGGTIQASSAGVGTGATFTIRLPRLSGADITAAEQPTPAPPPTEARTTSDASSLAGLEVLLVDDEEDTLVMFRDALEDAGAHVRTAASALDALREIDDWVPDLLVTDLGLPEMDGYELLRAIREKLSNQSFPAIAVSAYARLDDRSRTLAAGFQAHVAKPIDPAALVRILGAALSAPE